MNPTPSTSSYRDHIISAIAMVVVVIGMATGNALAMMGMAIVALVVMTLVYRQTSSRVTLSALAATLSVAFVLAVVVSVLVGSTQ